MSFTFGASAQPAGEGAQSGFTFGGTSSAGQSNSLFGNTSNQPAQRQSTGFSFGNTATSQPATGGFNFGTNTATSQPSTGGFSFGTSGAGTSGGLFGSTSQPSQSSTGGFGFGANTATSQPSTGRFGFGTSTTTSQPSTGGFSFGTNTATSQPATSGFSFGNAGGAGGLIGSTNQSSMTGTGSLFGSTSKPAQTGGFGSLFGNNTSNLQQSQAQAQRSRQVYDLLLQANAEARQEELLSASTKQKYRPKNTWQHLALINSYWDKNSPYCRFKYYFYNLVPPQEVHLYQKPPNHDQKAWDEAQRKNPDPSCLVPALAVSFSDLDKRVEAQKKQKDAQIATLQATEEKLNKLKSQNAERQKKIIESKKRQMELVQRVLHLIRYVTIIRRKGLSITPLEEKMTASLEYIQDQVQRSEQFHGKLSQLWAQWQLIKESGRKYGKIDGLEGWKGVSSENLQQMTKVLDELQNALEHTMQILEEDEKNVDKIIEQRGRYLQ